MERLESQHQLVHDLCGFPNGAFQLHIDPGSEEIGLEMYRLNLDGPTSPLVSSGRQSSMSTCSTVQRPSEASVELTDATLRDKNREIKTLRERNNYLENQDIERKAASENAEVLSDLAEVQGQQIKKAERLVSDLQSTRSGVVDLIALQQKAASSVLSDVQRIYRLDQEKAEIERQRQEKIDKVEREKQTIEKESQQRLQEVDMQRRYTMHQMNEHITSQKIRLDQQGQLQAAETDQVAQIQQAVGCAAQINAQVQKAIDELKTVNF